MAWLAVSVSTYDSDSVSFFPWTEILRTSHLGSTPPLAVGPFADGTNERLLKLGLKYFLQSDRVPLEEYLNLFWHSAGSLSIPVREACLGAAIEGIAQEVIERGSNNIVLEIKEAKQRFRACKQKLLAHIKKAGEEVLQDSSFGVLHGAIKQAEFFRAKEVLAKAVTAVGFTLSSSELKGWGDMRNDAAHDKSPVKEHDEKRYRDYYACIGILNKFALALIGYEGIIDDYSDLQRKTVNFKLWK